MRYPSCPGASSCFTVPGAALLALFSMAGAAAAQPVASRYDIATDGGGVTRTTEYVFTEKVVEGRHNLVAGSDAASARAVSAATGRPLPVTVAGSALVIRFDAPPAEGARHRVIVEERLTGERHVRRSGSALVFQGELAPGRHTVVLPAGHVLSAASSPAQVLVRDGRTHLGFVVADGPSVPVRIEAAPSAPLPETPLAGAFRAEDARSLVYFLEDPTAHRLSMWIELEVDRAGQGHVYSQLRKEDNITNARTVNLDTGRDLPTRIVSGAEANRIGDAGTTFPDGASVFVADLLAPVPQGGRVRARMFQTATDAASFRLMPDGGLRFDRFVARLRTQVVLPEGWDLTSVDQPAILSRDGRGRVVLDFLPAGANTPPLIVTARRRTGPS